MEGELDDAAVFPEAGEGVVDEVGLVVFVDVGVTENDVEAVLQFALHVEEVAHAFAAGAWFENAPGEVGIVGENALVKVAGLVGDVGALTRLARKFGGGGGWGEALEAFLDGAQGVGVYWRGAGEQEAVNVVAVDDVELAVIVAVAVDAGEGAAFPGKDVGGAAAEGVIDGKIVGLVKSQVFSRKRLE